MMPHSRPHITPEDMAAARRVLESGMLAEGDLAHTLAQRLSGLVGAAGALPCGSGTQALVLALRAAGVGPGGAVALPAYVCPEVAQAILHVGARPVFCDIGPDLLLRADQAREAAAWCDAVIIPYVLGRWADYSSLRGGRAFIIEDFAQFLMPRGGLFPGMCGDLATFSLNATKIVCAGEGGAVAAREPALLKAVRTQRRVDAAYPFNLYPLSDLNAALALAQLDRLEAMLATRRALAELHARALADIPGFSVPPAELEMHFRFVARAPEGTDLDALIKDFASRGVCVRRPVSTLAHRHAPGGAQDDDFPASRDALERMISLPLYPAMTADDSRVVAQAVAACCASLEPQRTRP